MALQIWTLKKYPNAIPGEMEQKSMGTELSKLARKEKYLEIKDKGLER